MYKVIIDKNNKIRLGTTGEIDDAQTTVNFGEGWKVLEFEERVLLCDYYYEDGELKEKDVKMEDLKAAQDGLNASDYKVTRHLEQLSGGEQTSLTEDEHKSLLEQRNKWRKVLSQK